MMILAAMLLDSIFGDPKGIPHPVTYIGRIISFWEKTFYSEKHAKARGVIFCAAVLISVLLIIAALFFAAQSINSYLFTVIKIYMLYAAIAFRSLKDESMKVAEALNDGDICKARKFLSYIVGRDTEKLDKNGIIRGSVETIAESYIDGVFAVLFYMVLGSFAGHAALFTWAYKAVNTMDSMVGYYDERYHDFGWCAAKLDDVLNFIPARLGALIAIAAGAALGFDSKNALKIFIRDRKKHKSPNSAHAESVYAGLLGISLGGGAFYGGEFEARPTLGDNTREPQTEDIIRSHKILTFSYALSACIIYILGRTI
ncbi:MAG: adenosylcobinamide-phosphate synthase CbiB [Synergistaceae bacterium]